MDTTSRFEGDRLVLPRCSHCGIASPLFHKTIAGSTTKEYSKSGAVLWIVYRCHTCGYPTVSFSRPDAPERLANFMPRAHRPHTDLPERAQEYLRQAMDSATVAPSGAITLCASAVDAMLKAKKYKKGSLYSRIEQAAKAHRITKSMAKWAHDVRLDANDERHDLPDTDDAQHCIDFVVALGEFMFVFPKRVTDGRWAAKAEKKGEPEEESEASPL